MQRSSSHPGQELARNTLWVLSAEGLVLPTGLVTAAILTRQLGPEGYGLLTLCATVISWLEWTTISLFARATIKFVGEADDWRPIAATVLRLHLALGVAAAVLLWAVAGVVADLLHEPHLAGYLRVFALNTPIFTLAQAHRQILVGTGRMRARAAVAASRWIARLALIVVLVGLSPSVWSAIAASVGASLVELVVARIYVRPSLFGRARIGARELFDFGVPLFFAAVSLRCLDRLDLLALKTLGGTAAQAGMYGAAQSLAGVPGLFCLSFAPLLLATLITTVRDGHQQLAIETGRDALRVTFWLLPFFALTAAAAPELIGWIFGASFLPAAPLFAVLIFAALAFMLIAVTSAILTAAGKPGWTFVLTGPLVPLALAGHLLVIPRWGAIGAAAVTAAATSCGAIAALVAVHRVWGISPPLGTLLRSAVLCGLAYALANVAPAPGVWVVLKLSVVGLAIACTFVLFGEFSVAEIAVSRSFVRWRRRAGASG